MLKNSIILTILMLLFSLLGYQFRYNVESMKLLSSFNSTIRKSIDFNENENVYFRLFDSSGIKACGEYSAIAFGRFYCHANKLGDPDLILLGDSHAEHLFPGLDYYFGGNLVIQSLGIGGCPPFVSKNSIARRPEGGKGCENEYNGIFDVIYKKKPKTIVVSSLNRYYYDGLGFAEYLRGEYYSDYVRNNSHGSDSHLKTNLINDLQSLFDKLSTYNAKIFYLLDIPHLAVNPLRCSPNYVFSPKSCNYSSSYYFNYEEEFRSIIFDVSVKYPNIVIIDPSRLFCSELNCVFGSFENSLYRDKDHLSISGSLLLGNYLSTILTSQNSLGTFGEVRQ